MSDRRPGNAVQRLPLPGLFLFAFVVWTGGRLLLAHGVIDPLRIVVDSIGGLVVATVLTVVLGRRRRRLGGTDASLEYAKAIRTGIVPDGAATAGWSEETERSERRLRVDRWVIRIGGLLPFGLGVWAITEPDSRVLGIVLAALMLAGWIYTEIETPRLLARIGRVRTTLRG